MKTFINDFNTLPRIAEFDTEWENGTGYLDGIVRAKLGLAEGERVGILTHDGRRGIVVGTYHGNAVIFERYTPKENGELTGPLVHNIPSVFRGMVSNCVTEGEYDIYFGNNSNIGNIAKSLRTKVLRFSILGYKINFGYIRNSVIVTKLDGDITVKVKEYLHVITDEEELGELSMDRQELLETEQWVYDLPEIKALLDKEAMLK